MTAYAFSITFTDYAGTPVTVDLTDASYEMLAVVRDAANVHMAALDAEYADVA